MSKQIPLSKGNFAIIDDLDFGFIGRFKWHTSGSEYPYAVRFATGGKKREIIHMHRLLMGVGSDVTVDHINHNTLDNRRENLRVCTLSENLGGQVSLKPGFKSIYGPFGKKRPRWRAFCASKYLGTYGSEEEAVKAYNDAAVKRWGQFALLNRIPNPAT
jgi:hypothetical protein